MEDKYNITDDELVTLAAAIWAVILGVEENNEGGQARRWADQLTQDPGI